MAPDWIGKVPPYVTTAVYKFPIALDERSSVRMPRGAKILSVGMRGPQMFAWTLVEKGRTDTVERRFSIFGTGHTIPDDHIGVFVGTVLDGPYVWHIFVDPEQEQRPRDVNDIGGEVQSVECDLKTVRPDPAFED